MNNCINGYKNTIAQNVNVKQIEKKHILKKLANKAKTGYITIQNVIEIVLFGIEKTHKISIQKDNTTIASIQNRQNKYAKTEKNAAIYT